MGTEQRFTHNTATNGDQFYGNSGNISIVNNFGAPQGLDDSPNDLTWFKLDRAIEAELYAARDGAKSTQCLEGTRIELLSDIEAWINDKDAPSIFWLSGVAGSGKSTVSRTVAQRLYDSCCLGACFFFSRDQFTTSHTKLLVSTLAFQLVKHFPTVGRYVREAIQQEPKMADMSLAYQWKELVVSPVEKARGEPGMPLSLVLIFDALDECQDNDAVELISAVLTSAARLQEIQARLLFTCRQKSHIDSSFRKIPQDSKKHIVLHEVDRANVDRDIRLLLESELPEHLRQSIPQKDLEKIIELSQGLFIFAATVCRYIRKIPQLAQKRLLGVISNQSSKYLSPLDQLYLQALQEVVDVDADADEIDELCMLLKNMAGTVVNLANPLPVRAIAGLLDEPLEQARSVLESLRAVFSVPETDEQSVRALHESFHDFLLDNMRCTDTKFYVQPVEVHNFLVDRCINLMNGQLKRDICDCRVPGTLAEDFPQDCPALSIELRYACRYWVYHLQNGNTTLKDDGFEHNFLQAHFLHWLESLSITGLIRESISMISSLLSMVQISLSPRLHAFMSDMRRFVLANVSMIEAAPLQVYSSAVIFAPSNSVVKHVFKDHQPAWIKNRPSILEDWNALLQTLEGHSDYVNSVALSPDGKHIVSGSDDETVRIWSAATGANLQKLEGHKDKVNSVAFSPDGSKVMSGSSDGTARLWDVATGVSFLTLNGHLRGVLAVAFSPSSNTVLSGSSDWTIRLWDVNTGRVLKTLSGHSNNVNSVAFSPDGKNIVSSSSDKNIHVWDVETGELLHKMNGHIKAVRSAAFSPDGSKIVSGSDDQTLQIWDTASGLSEKHMKHSSAIRTVLFSSDGSKVLFTSHKGTSSILWIWDLITDTLQALIYHSSRFQSFVVASDGSKIVSASSEYTVRVWDAMIGVPQIPERHTQGVRTIALSPDGCKVVSGSRDNSVRIWDALTGKQLCILNGHSNWVDKVVFSQPEGSRIVSTCDDGITRIWDTSNGENIQTLNEFDGSVFSIAVSSLGNKKIVCGSDGGTISIWEAESGKLLQNLKLHADRIWDVKFSPVDGSTIASGSGRTVQIWDASNGSLLWKLKGHSRTVLSVAFAPEGSKVASGSRDKTVRIWDLSTGKMLHTLKGHSGSVNEVEFSPTDGSKVVSRDGDYADGDHIVRVWNSTSGALLHVFEARFSPIAAIARSLDNGLPIIDIYDRWVRLDGKRILLLPEDREPYAVDMQDHKLAIGAWSGIITVLEFDLELLKSYI